MNQTLEEKFENFSSLSNDECTFIISNYLVEAIESSVYIDWEIVSKFLTVPYLLREDLCKLFNSAIKKNQQKIGNLTVSEWIKLYTDNYAYKERTPNTFFDFVKNSEKTQELTKRNKIKLMRVLRIYDYLFIVPIFDMEGPVSSILRFPMWLEPTPEQTAIQNNQIFKEKTIATPKIVTENISISEALKQYPEIGEQLITFDHIKIRNSSNLTRPSIKNWLSDYVANLGYKNHSSMIRGNYLFQNENTKNLSYQDRQKLSQLLKSFDEKTPLTIDITAKQIVFLTSNIQNSETNRDSVLKKQSSKLQTSFESPDNTKVSVSPTIMSTSQIIENNHQPKTQEPGANFEKVIRLEEKKSESVFPNISKVVNLKETEKEKASIPKTPIKNLVNIKELINTNEEENKKMFTKPLFEPKKDTSEITLKETKPLSSFTFQKEEETRSKKTESILAANNSIIHESSFSPRKTSWINNTIEPLDEAEKKLFESNNGDLDKNQTKSNSNSLIAGIPVKDFSKEKKETRTDIQFTSSQKLSHEREQEEIQKKPVTQEKLQIPQAPKMQPYRIRPVSFEDI